MNNHLFHKYRNVILAALIPCAVTVLLWIWWPDIKPLIWFLFYPAVFFSSWVGGRAGGILATFLSAGAIIYFFTPPGQSFRINDLSVLFAAGIFILVGFLFSHIHASLIQANRQAASLRSIQESEIAERRRVEQVLAERNATLTTLMNSPSDIIIFSLDRDYRYTAFNERHRQEMRTIWNAEIELGMNMLEAMTVPELRESARQSLDRVLAGMSFSEIRLQPEHDIFYEIYWSPSRQEDGEVTGIVAFIRDITERRQAELALKESEERLHSLFENMLDGYAYCKLLYQGGRPVDFLYVEVNQAFEQLTGLKDVAGRKVSEVIPGLVESNPGLFEVYGRVVLTGKPEKFETYIEPLGIWLSISLYSPRPEHFVAVFDNITERRRAEAELRESEQRLAGILNSQETLIVRVDTQNRILYMNDAYQRAFGLKVGDTFWTKVHPDDEPATEAALAKLWVPPYRCTLEQRCEVHGEWRNILWQDSVVTDDDGSIAEIQGIGFDITERKQAEEALARQTEELRRSNRELEQFAYVASHDLQDPLTMITSYLQLIEQRYRGRLDADADELIAFAVDGADRMKALIGGLLAYSRIGTRGREFWPIESSYALDQVKQNLQAAIETSGTLITSSALPRVHADETQLVQLFQNLIGNAIKFNRSRPPQIHVHAWPGEGETVFSVKDNGIGIDPEFSEEIFEIFQRLHPRDEYNGSGIGLAVCKKIVERHGGQIWVESQPGEGSTFYFTIKNSSHNPFD
jgi:PAS domain S-box-containing protein